MRRRRRLFLADEGTENFWPAFTDLTSTIALILFVLVLLAYIQNLLNARNLERARAELAATMERLGASQQKVDKAERRLRRLAAEIEAGQDQLRLSELKVQQQEQVISDSSRELSEVRAQLRGIALLRLSTLQKVKTSIEAEMGRQGQHATKASIGPNGNIVLDESLLFEIDSATIKRGAKPFLDSLAGALLAVLGDFQVRESIDVVLVQGHTDARGTTTYNRELSARRSNAVLNYLFAARPELEREHGRYFASSAYSEFRPINPGKGEAAMRENRRIEISVVLRDSSIREVIDGYMRNIDPALREGKGDTGAEQEQQQQQEQQQ
ncbi:MAG: OmpA family protein [Myxococcales bacterium]|nr:OmpA family protein [Myxococcales bacterium]